MNVIAIAFFVVILLFLILLLAVYSARKRSAKNEVSEVIANKMLIKITVPQNNEKGPESAEILYQALHGILKNKPKAFDHLSFEIFAHSTGVFFLMAFNSQYLQFIENQIYAQYPDAQITVVKDYAENLNYPQIQIKELTLSKPFYLPIKTFSNFEVDPLASITASLSKLSTQSIVALQLLVRPIDNTWQSTGNKYISDLKNKKDEKGNKVGLESTEAQEISEIEKKNNKLGFEFVIRLLSAGPDEVTVNSNLENLMSTFKQFQAPQLNSLKEKTDKKNFFKRILSFFFENQGKQKMLKIKNFRERFLSSKEKGILNTEEIASIYHLPTKNVQTPTISWVKSRKLEIPQNLPINEGRLFGLTDYRGQHFPFGIKKMDRRRHMYVIGKTGAGKSVLLKNMVAGDILDGEGLAFIDPHGDAVEEILNLIPQHRVEDVIYIDPSDVEFPIAFNMLDAKSEESLELLADGIVAVFKKFFEDSWGPRLQHILSNTIYTLLHCQNVSLLAVQRILVDKNYRKFLLKQVKDPFVKKFWIEEFDQMAKNPRLITEAIAPIQNKVGRFLGSPMVRNMMGQVTSAVDLQHAMNSGKIVLVNLSQGKIGEENSSLLGAMIITRLYSNAMQRAKIPESERRDFYLYVDEFQNFATDTFIKILSEARKYGLNLIVAHQYIDQLSEGIQDAIFGNVGTLVNFVVGPKDAERLAKEYSPYLTQEDIVNLERFRFASKMTIDGSQSKPFTGISLAPRYVYYNLSEQIVNRSRAKYSKPRDVVVQKLNKWVNQKYDNKGNIEIEKPQNDQK
ncbi:MAG: hypothetical protein KatS3mg085_121 [Candidatus Dojkabacteria bacterium]|nr:MAG: hypothetical protein KatS3mg085_121 [Candidatus Dojkabacteria bacterium]